MPWIPRIRREKLRIAEQDRCPRWHEATDALRLRWPPNTIRWANHLAKLWKSLSVRNVNMPTVSGPERPRSWRVWSERTVSRGWTCLGITPNPNDSPAVAFWASCVGVWISAKRAKLCNATPLEIIEQLIARRAFPWRARDDVWSFLRKYLIPRRSLYWADRLRRNTTHQLRVELNFWSFAKFPSAWVVRLHLLPNTQPSVVTISVSSFLGANLRNSPPAPESGSTSSLHFNFETPRLGGLFKARPTCGATGPKRGSQQLACRGATLRYGILSSLRIPRFSSFQWFGFPKSLGVQ